MNAPPVRGGGGDGHGIRSMPEPGELPHPGVRQSLPSLLCPRLVHRLLRSRMNAFSSSKELLNEERKGPWVINRDIPRLITPLVLGVPLGQGGAPLNKTEHTESWDTDGFLAAPPLPDNSLVHGHISD